MSIDQAKAQFKNLYFWEILECAAKVFGDVKVVSFEKLQPEKIEDLTLL